MDVARSKQGGGFKTLLRKKNFVYLWLAQLISMTILNASNYAIMVLVEEVTGSTTLVGVAIISFSLPALLFSAPAGVFVDRLDKRLILWGSNCLRAIASFGFVISLLIDARQLIPAYLLTFLISSIGQFFTPAESSTIPLLVDEDELMPALALFNITFMTSMALGMIIFAPLVLSLLPTFQLFSMTVQPVETLYFLIGLLYLLCAGLILLIPPPAFEQHTPHRPAASGEDLATQSLSLFGNIGSEMRQGWLFIRQNKPLLLAVVQLSFAGILLALVAELATALVTRLFLLPADTLAFVFAPAGIGLVLGSLFMPRITRRLGISRSILLGCLGFALIILLLPLLTLIARSLQPTGWNTQPLFLGSAALIMFLGGIALDCINIPAQTRVQEETPEWIKGRVLALQLMLYNAGTIPVILLTGAAADLLGIDRVIYLLSLAILLFALWGFFYERRHPAVATCLQEEPEEEYGQEEFESEANEISR
ncbi:MFS transporter [Thermogemmatispora carboxidivorans]|uniref:MFS transporter n=1 Tax=Thermogemmatispora carboxidivorans TaxID=1382306 RepID=UPI00069A89B4|nr:MFS transporter [Thermogemmatispora carboxidivorans]